MCDSNRGENVYDSNRGEFSKLVDEEWDTRMDVGFGRSCGVGLELS